MEQNHLHLYLVARVRVGLAVCVGVTLFSAVTLSGWAADAAADSTSSTPQAAVTLIQAGPLLDQMLDSTDVEESRVLSKALGDAHLAGLVVLNEEDQEKVARYVLHCLEQCTSESAGERVEARHQIHRLWRVTVPTLLEQMNNRDMTQLELAMKSLILMRDESIILQLIEKGRNSEDTFERRWVRFVLTRMNEKRETTVSDRTCLDETRSQELYQHLVMPALATWPDEVTTP